jgi:RHS repeat-associated protein
MDKFGVGIERVELPHVRGEYEEVYITLPDGREFFFANAPNEENIDEDDKDDFWETKGYYAIHPFGMKLWRRGASLHDTSGNGGLANLQSDDGTVYRFSWPDGDLIDVTSVEENVVNFTNQGDTQYIEDSYERQIKIERETVLVSGVGNVTRIKKITDPTGKHWFEYKYDSVNNLVEVVEKTSNSKKTPRRTWFHYGELEVDGEIKYYPIHYLTEMIEDTNGNETEDDSDRRTTFAYDEEGRLEEVESPAGTASLGYEDNYADEEYQGGRQTVTDELTGAVTTIDHDISGNATQVQDPMGLTTVNEFYADGDESEGAIPGALKSTTDPEGNTTDYEYDSTIIDPEIPQGMAASLTHMLSGGVVMPNGYLTSTVAQPKRVFVNTIKTMENNLHLAESDAATGKLGKPIDTTDAAGTTTSFTYDNNGGNLATVDREGTVFVETTYYGDEAVSGKGFRLDGRVYEEKDQEGNITRYVYEIHIDGGTTGYTQWVEETKVINHAERPDSDDWLISTTIQDALGRTLESTNERGITSKSKYNADGRVIESRTIYQGATLSRTINEYNPDGTTKQTTTYPKGATPRTTRYFYDQVGRTLCTVFPDNNWTATRHYPEKETPRRPNDMPSEIYSQVWGSEWPQGVDGWQGRATVSYSSDGKIEVSKEDLAGRGVESYTLAHDADGHLHKRGSRTEYNDKGQAWRSYRVTGVNGADTETLLSSTYYDNDGRQLRTWSEIDGINTAEYDYDEFGRTRWTRAANGTYSTSAYDQDGRVVRTHSGIDKDAPLPLDARYFDGTLAGTDPFLAGIRMATDETYVRYVFDGLGKIEYEVSPNDGVGEATTAYEYDSEGRQTKIIHNYVDGTYSAGADGTDKDIAYETFYDKYGQRSAIKDAKGHYTWFEYDDFGRLYRKILDNDDDPDPTGPDGDDPYEEYTYDNARGLLTAKRNYDGGVINYQYGPLTDRKTTETYEDGLEITYEYDNQGRLTSVVETKNENTRTTALNYDPVTDQPSRIAKPEGTLNYSYNELGSLERVHESAGSGVDYKYYYTLGGRLDAVETPSGQTKYTYEDWGSRVSQTLPNGVFTRYEYDNLLRTDRIAHYENDGEDPTDLLAEFDYTVGQTGRCLAVKETIDAAVVNIAYAYDGLGRLTQSDRDDNDSYDRSFTYDVVGNRLTKEEGSGPSSITTTYAYNPLDQLTWQNRDGTETDYTYDDNGNLQSQDEDGKPIRYFEYDDRNRLTKVHDGGTGPADLTLAYSYDLEGNRVAKAEYNSGTPLGTTGYLVDGSNLTGHSQTFYEYDADSGSIDRLYEYGDDLSAELDLAGASSQDPQYFLYDGLGTTRSLITDSGAGIEQTFNFTPFGEAVDHPSSPATSKLFTGEEYDSQLEQYYLRSRMYDPAIGRFTSFDRAEDENNKLHKYAYCGGDAVNAVDLSGLYYQYNTVTGTQAHLLFTEVMQVIYDKYWYDTAPDAEYNLRPDVYDPKTGTFWDLKPITNNDGDLRKKATAKMDLSRNTIVNKRNVNETSATSPQWNTNRICCSTTKDI